MFYSNYLKLCKSVNKTPSAVAEEIGFRKSTVTRWKQGHGQTDSNKQKVAKYFGVTVEELEYTEKQTTDSFGFYESYICWCNSISKSPCAVADEIGLSRPAITRWKNGSIPIEETMLKVANYFGVSIDQFMEKRLEFENKEQEAKTPKETKQKQDNTRDSVFYNNFLSLCAWKRTTPSGVSAAIGLSRTAANGWKKGKVPSQITLLKLANYFGVSTQELTEKIIDKEIPKGNSDGFSENDIIRFIDWFRSQASDKEKALVRMIVNGDS